MALADRPPPHAPSQSITDSDYRLMVDAVRDYAIFMLDCDGRILTWNAGAQRLKGYAADEIIGRGFEIFYSADQIQSGLPRRELDVALQHGRVEDEGWRLRKDGTRFWASVVITALQDADGRHRGFAKVTRDLTSRRDAEELLRQSEENFRLLIEGVRDYAIFMLDPTGHIISWNLGAQITKGYIAEEIIGQHFSVFYPAEKIEQGWPQMELEQALRDGSFEDEGWRLRKDGSRFWASVVITALRDAGGRHRGFAKVTRDLTEKHRIHALEDEGRQLTQFIAVLGHELRNPLSSISNGVSILQLEGAATPRQETVQGVMARQVAQLRRLVDDLLDVGRLASGKVRLEREPVRLQVVVAEALEAMASALEERGLQVESTIAVEDLCIIGDKARLVQVLTNLLHNACKFTPEGGRVRVTLARQADDAELTVSDTGGGIASQDLEHIFKLFARGEDTTVLGHGGLGIGLSLVYQMVTRHGGDISAFSTGVAGEGAKFVLRLSLMP